MAVNIGTGDEIVKFAARSHQRSEICLRSMDKVVDSFVEHGDLESGPSFL